MKEQAIVFGEHRHLVGVVTWPMDTAARPVRAAIMSNIGTHHRVGPFRLYVDLARALAEQGFVALRFDLAGHGDSDARPGATDVQGSMQADVGDAMRWMTEHADASSFILVGLCSGVDSVHASAVANRQVTGAVFIDGYAYPSAGFLVRRHLFRYFAPERWRRFVRRRLRRIREGGVIGAPDDDIAPTQFYQRVYPTHVQFKRDVASLVDRGARLLFVYTGSVHLYYNARGQIYEQLGRGIRRDRIEVEYIPQADHLFSKLEYRSQLLDRICSWAGSLAE